MMDESITTTGELDALPVGSVVLDRHGTAWQRVDSRYPDGGDIPLWRAADISRAALPAQLAANAAPLILLTPDQPPAAAGPATVKPSVEQVAQRLFLHQYPGSGGWDGPGWQKRRQPWLAKARAVLVLFPGRTEAEIVCICGSTRFRDEITAANRDLTLAGKIVLGPGVFGHSGDPITDAQKEALDVLHLQKIDLADRVLVVNPGGHIGDSTRREVAYAQKVGKPVEYTHRFEREG